MARPIAETPILFGEDAKRFVEAMQNVKPASAERIARIKEGYNRLKFGIGNDFPKGMQVDFVLGKFSAEDNKIIDKKAPVAVGAIKAFCLSGMPFAMNHYNGK